MFVQGFKLKSEANQGENNDDVGATNLKMICNNGKEIDGSGVDKWGTWDSKDYQKCPEHSYYCGAQARLEGNQHNGDDTGINQIKMICCKPKKDSKYL